MKKVEITRKMYTSLQAEQKRLGKQLAAAKSAVDKAEARLRQCKTELG